MKLLYLEGFGFRNSQNQIGILFADAVFVSGKQNSENTCSFCCHKCVFDVFRAAAGGDTEEDISLSAECQKLLGKREASIDVIAERTDESGMREQGYCPESFLQMLGFFLCFTADKILPDIKLFV